MLTVFGAVAELEREYILQRQREGIAIAKAQGKYTGRKPIKRSNFDAVEKLWRAGTISAAEARRRLDFPGFSMVSRFAKNNNTFLHSLQQGGKAVRNNFRSWLIHSRRRKPL